MTGFENVEYASLTDVGIRRSHNQDAHAILLATDREEWKDRGHIFLIADGMGAHAVGELASKLAVDIIPHTYTKYAHEGAAAALRKAFVEANMSIHTRGQQNREFAGMGTTGTALLLRPEGAWLGHVGDSRAYRIRDGKIEQLTFDHSLHWELARRQKINPENLQGIPSNVIVRSLGPEPLVQVDVEGPHPLLAGDTFVMCSDGLSGPVSDHEIGVVASVLPPAEACHFLIDLANLRGGPDNITVVIVRVTGPVESPKPARSAIKNDTLWYQSVPWPFGALVIGVLLAAVAAWLTYENLPGYGFVFLLAALCLVSGMVGLLIHHKQEQEELANAPEPPEIHVYHQTSTEIQQPMLDKMVRAEDLLRERIRDKQITVDWDNFKKHHDLAEVHKSRGEPQETFREYCRALRILSEAVLKLHNKGEGFRPLWDNSPE